MGDDSGRCGRFRGIPSVWNQHILYERHGMSLNRYRHDERWERELEYLNIRPFAAWWSLMDLFSIQEY